MQDFQKHQSMFNKILQVYNFKLKVFRLVLNNQTQTDFIFGKITFGDRAQFVDVFSIEDVRKKFSF